MTAKPFFFTLLIGIFFLSGCVTYYRAPAAEATPSPAVLTEQERNFDFSICTVNGTPRNFDEYKKHEAGLIAKILLSLTDITQMFTGWSRQHVLLARGTNAIGFRIRDRHELCVLSVDAVPGETYTAVYEGKDTRKHGIDVFEFTISINDSKGFCVARYPALS